MARETLYLREGEEVLTASTGKKPRSHDFLHLFPDTIAISEGATYQEGNDTPSREYFMKKREQKKARRKRSTHLPTLVAMILCDVCPN